MKKPVLSIPVLSSAVLLPAALAASAAPAPVVPGLFPPDVRTVGIVSISSPLARKALDDGTNALAKAGYRVKVSPNAGSAELVPPEVRARLLEEAWLDPEIDILWFSRGGQGAADVVPLLDWERLRARPDRRVVGFSDVTLLLNAMLAKGAGHPYSGPMLSALRYWNADSRDWFAATLRGEAVPDVRCRALRADGGGGAAVGGPPAGGHLERVHRLFKMGLWPSVQGRVVFLECTAKYPPGQIRSCLEELRDGGAFAGAAAVVFADFRHEGAARAALDEYLPAFAQTLPCPVFADYPYGHCPESRMLDFRRGVSISPDGAVRWR